MSLREREREGERERGRERERERERQRERGNKRVSNLVFYIQSTIAIIAGQKESETEKWLTQ